MEAEALMFVVLLVVELVVVLVVVLEAPAWLARRQWALDGPLVRAFV